MAWFVVTEVVGEDYLTIHTCVDREEEKSAYPPAYAGAYWVEGVALDDGKVPYSPSRFQDGRELEDAETASRIAAQVSSGPLIRGKVSPASVAELESLISAVSDDATRAALDKLARVVAKGYPSAGD